jgi:site-specific recombinase XerD
MAVDGVELLEVAEAASLPTLAPEAREKVRSYQRADKADSTVRAYKSDAFLFDAWCGEQGLSRSVPATPDAVAAFLAHEADRGVKASTISRRAAAISYAHKLAGHPDPLQSEHVRSTMRGIRRTLGTAQAQKAPATVELVITMLSHCPQTLAGKRDRAILALGFSGAFRRSELAALYVSDLRVERDGIRVQSAVPRPTRRAKARRLQSRTGGTSDQSKHSLSG